MRKYKATSEMSEKEEAAATAAMWADRRRLEASNRAKAEMERLNALDGGHRVMDFGG